MVKPNIVILYSEVMPYTIGVIRELKKQSGCKVLLVHWDANKLTPFTFDETVLLDIVIPRTQCSFSTLRIQLNSFKPDLIWVSGRMDRLYLNICLTYSRKIPIVMGCDNPWYGTLNNFIRQILAWFLYRRFFSHCWVPGVSQYLFCRKMGFSHESLKMDLYSADSVFFKRERIPSGTNRFLYVGRFAEVKNIQRLIKAFQQIAIDRRKGWKLRLVGSGDITSYLKNPEPDIEVYSFENQKRLVNHAQESVVFILPSVNEPWGVVVHEFAALGMPLLLSQNVGASNAFLINGYNGYSFDPLNTNELSQRMEQMISADTNILAEMGARSKHLAERITPSTAAANLLSIIR
jgi:glycosyltransferase involved in cell wall biosynthesis